MKKRHRKGRWVVVVDLMVGKRMVKRRGYRFSSLSRARSFAATSRREKWLTEDLRNRVTITRWHKKNWLPHDPWREALASVNENPWEMGMYLRTLTQEKLMASFKGLGASP